MIEVCVDSLESAINAIHGGADELEVCSSLAEGGLTPTIGLVQRILALVRNIGSGKSIHRTCSQCKCHELHQKPSVNIMIRCRAGSDFCYTDTEMDTMLADLITIKTLHVDRFVFGALTKAREIDEDNCARVIIRAQPTPVTFHRAFDMCKDPILTVEKILKLGFSRILTSGQRPTVEDPQAFQLISDLLGIYKDRIEIMPGAGVNHDNVKKYIRQGCTIVHSSCKAVKELPKIDNNLCMGSSTTESICCTDENNVIKIKSVIKNEILQMNKESMANYKCVFLPFLGFRTQRVKREPYY